MRGIVFPGVSENLFGFGAGDFRKEGRDWKLTFDGVGLSYMATHGKKAKGNEVPVGGTSGIDRLAKKMAEVAEGHNLPHGGGDQYSKKVLKGYAGHGKDKPALGDCSLIGLLFFVAYLVAVRLLL